MMVKNCAMEKAKCEMCQKDKKMFLFLFSRGLGKRVVG